MQTPNTAPAHMQNYETNPPRSPARTPITALFNHMPFTLARPPRKVRADFADLRLHGVNRKDVGWFPRLKRAMGSAASNE
jgi:hypothetical protein